ncbi:synaptotagmin-like protein 2 isoform X3 [Takifugu rubripes]|uniref:synaptotagmin-like protein 2 isoform X3 n=1 Tax=Takifugu rubripes TaxID=31033 RepID=UPI0011460C71|nr:synaptotagmin-like protein 2 isoform X3 [Takifugu rubripes]
MIDLSFLTEEEQEIIQDVLKRDAELKKAEEQRIQNLQKTVSDRDLLRYMTGEWFYETKQLRHQERIHSTDIIRASMKQAQKPLTILELTQMFKPPVVSSAHEDVFTPPAHRGTLQVIQGRDNNESCQRQEPPEMARDAPTPVAQSPPKQRRNPFDSEVEGRNSGKNGAAEGPLASRESCTPAADPRADLASCALMHNAFDPPPVAENLAVSIRRQGCSAEVDRPEARKNITPATRGVPEHVLAASGAVLHAPLDPQDPVKPASSAESSSDRKQVRPSSTDAPARAAWRDGKELGEHTLLDMDRMALAEAEGGDLESTGRLDLQTDLPPLVESPTDEELQGKNQDLPQEDVAGYRLLGDVAQRGAFQFQDDTRHAETEEVRHSQDDHQEASGPMEPPLKQSPSKRMASSKSLENLTSQSGEERNKDYSKDHVNPSVDADSKQMKSSLSVPFLQLEETDSDGTFGPALPRRNTGSSASNFSLSSGLNSMSSISSSISSIYPADFGELEVQGSIQFAVNYIQKLGEFQVFVVDCRDLAVADVKKNRSDPYVKCYLLPDKSKLGKRKTAVKKKTSHPTFNEILRFKTPLELLKSQTLNVSVWHNDTFGRNNFLGEVDVDLSGWDFGNTRINEYVLQARASAQPSPSSRSMDDRGQMRVAVRFLPQTSHSKRTSGMETGEVQIWVKDCKNLPPVRGVTIDPFVKCAVLPDTSRKSRQKTRVVKRTANPMFNHTMVYDGFRTQDLREACVEITVWDHDRLRNHFLGGLRLGLGTGRSYGVDVVWMDSTPEEADLWQRMLQSDGEWVEDILPLRMLMMTKCK